MNEISLKVKTVSHQDSIKSLHENGMAFATETHLLSRHLIGWRMEILLPRSFKNWQAVSLSGPSDSTAIGWKIHILSITALHLLGYYYHYARVKHAICRPSMKTN